MAGHSKTKRSRRRRFDPPERAVPFKERKDILETIHHGNLKVAYDMIASATGQDLETSQGRQRAVELMQWEGAGYTASPRLLMARIVWAKRKP